MKLGDIATALRAHGRPCWRKQGYRTQGAAEAQKRSLLRRGLEKDAETINTYQCPHCGEWHVGHSEWRRTSATTTEEGR